MTPFKQELESGKIIIINGQQMPMALYNLIVSKRDLELYAIGLIPHRGWKITSVKKYLGLTGRDKKEYVKQIREILTNYKNG